MIGHDVDVRGVVFCKLNTCCLVHVFSNLCKLLTGVKNHAFKPDSFVFLCLKFFASLGQCLILFCNVQRRPLQQTTKVCSFVKCSGFLQFFGQFRHVCFLVNG